MKSIICGSNGKYIGRYKRIDKSLITWHRIVADSTQEAMKIMLKGTNFTSSEVIIKEYEGWKWINIK